MLNWNVTEYLRGCLNVDCVCLVSYLRVSCCCNEQTIKWPGHHVGSTDAFRARDEDRGHRMTIKVAHHARPTTLRHILVRVHPGYTAKSCP